MQEFVEEMIFVVYKESHACGNLVNLPSNWIKNASF